jgi:signal transduction histidine kinase
MKRADALRMLRLGTASERLEAARFLALHAKPSDLKRLQSASQREADYYVGVALNEAIKVISNTLVESPLPDEEELDEALVRVDEYARGYREATLMVVHELSTTVGRIRSAARGEIADFETSVTQTRLDRLEGLIAAVEKIGVASNTPEYEEFDLAGLVMDIAATVSEATEVPIEVAGADVLLLVSDSGLIHVAVTNGIKNACESTLATNPETRMPVIVSWGGGDRDTWVSIADRGLGLPDDLQDPFAFAESRKANHLGVGLALARRAIDTLGGTVNLRGREGGGAYYEVRWPRTGESR